MNLQELASALAQSRCKETCYEPDQIKRSVDNPAFGQCYVTSLIVQDHFGGDIVKTKLDNGIGHFRNCINREDIDLTRSQFKNNEILPPPVIVNRTNMEENERYNLLKSKVATLLEGAQ